MKEKSVNLRNEEINKIFAEHRIGVQYLPNNNVKLFFNKNGQNYNNKTYTSDKPNIVLTENDYQSKKENYMLEAIENKACQYQPWEQAHDYNDEPNTELAHECIDFKVAIMNSIYDIRKNLFHDNKLKRSDMVVCYDKDNTIQFAYLSFGNGNGVTLGNTDKKLNDDTVCKLAENKAGNFNYKVFPCMAYKGTISYINVALRRNQPEYVEEQLKYVLRTMKKGVTIDSNGTIHNDIKISNSTFPVEESLNTSKTLSTSLRHNNKNNNKTLSQNNEQNL